MKNKTPLYLYAVKYNYLCEKYDRSLTDKKDHRGMADINHNPEIRRKSITYSRELYARLVNEYKEKHEMGFAYGTFMKAINGEVAEYSFDRLEMEYERLFDKKAGIAP